MGEQIQGQLHLGRHQVLEQVMFQGGQVPGLPVAHRDHEGEAPLPHLAGEVTIEAFKENRTGLEILTKSLHEPLTLGRQAVVVRLGEGLVGESPGRSTCPSRSQARASRRAKPGCEGGSFACCWSQRRALAVGWR